jgi:soluble lytic murein transglycosylase-like protein
MSRFTQKHLLGTLWSFTRNGVMVAGLIALIAWEVQTFSHAKPAPAAAVELDFGPPLLTNVQPVRLKADAAAQAEEADLAAGTPASVEVHKRIAAFLAKKYLVSAEAVEHLVASAFVAGKETGVDPALILSVMAIESRFNPFAESPMGAKGLMQVIPKYHMDKFDEVGGKDAVLNPVANIKVGALILQDYIRRFGGTEAALKAYSGATGDDNGYASKVIVERDRLRAASTGKLVYTPATAQPPAAAKVQPVMPVEEPKAIPLTQLDTRSADGV